MAKLTAILYFRYTLYYDEHNKLCYRQTEHAKFTKCTDQNLHPVATYKETHGQGLSVYGAIESFYKNLWEKF